MTSFGWRLFFKTDRFKRRKYMRTLSKKSPRTAHEKTIALLGGMFATDQGSDLGHPQTRQVAVEFHPSWFGAFQRQPEGTVNATQNSYSPHQGCSRESNSIVEDAQVWTLFRGIEGSAAKDTHPIQLRSAWHPSKEPKKDPSPLSETACSAQLRQS